MALGLASVFLGVGFTVELLVLRARGRQSTLVAVLPQICESLSSAVTTGIDIQQAFEDLAIAGPKQTRKSLHLFCEQLQLGVQMDEALNWLKVELANAESDQLIELLRLSRSSGGIGLSSNLNRLGSQLRQQAALAGEISAKQGWVTGTAKLALATPWIIVLLLGSRPENALAYNSSSGLLVLSIGLVICLTAYAVINAVSSLPEPKRVYAK
jgi:tight adherence protein B